MEKKSGADSRNNGRPRPVFPPRSDFLPMTCGDLEARGWESCDFILVTGDAYVDHPSFANGMISRVLEWAGFRVGVISQPQWEDERDIARLGRPRLAFLVSAGNLDSMLNAYTAAKLPRSEDLYSPGGKAHMRPNRATIVYCNLIRRAFGKIPIVIGGLEASLRRFAHYDYWEDRVRRSILLDSNANLLVFGMGEQQAVEIASRLDAGENIQDMKDIRGTAYVKHEIDFLESGDFVERFGEPRAILPYESLLPDQGREIERVQEGQSLGTPPAYRKNYAIAFREIEEEQDPVRGRALVQRSGNLHVVQMPPAALQSEEELDRWYDLPFTRLYHPDYEAQGGVPAWETTRNSIVTHRGCLGSCSFCALTMHQGRIVQSRSVASIVREAERIASMPGFCGHISDVGGPTANMYANFCPAQQKKGACLDRDCLLPHICPALRQNIEKQLEMLARVSAIPRIQHAFISSGIRYDMLLDSKSAGEAGSRYIAELAAKHTSGHLKVAPEHISPEVLALMRKPAIEKFEKFQRLFLEASRRASKEQYLVAYFMSSHPGCTMEEQIRLAEYLRQTRWSPEQVQDFIPTPMTASTAMFYSGYDPRSLKPVYTPTTMSEKRTQRASMQFDRGKAKPGMVGKHPEQARKRDTRIPAGRKKEVTRKQRPKNKRRR